MVNHGVYLQTFRIITGIFENVVLVSQGILLPPNIVTTSLTRPTFSSNSIRKIRPMAMAAHIFGRKVAVLKNALAELLFKYLLFNRDAMSRAQQIMNTSPVSQ